MERKQSGGNKVKKVSPKKIVADVDVIKKNPKIVNDKFDIEVVDLQDILDLDI